MCEIQENIYTYIYIWGISHIYLYMYINESYYHTEK